MSELKVGKTATGGDWDGHIMWLKQCHKPPMTENGLCIHIYIYTTYIFGDDWWMVYYCFTHIKATQMVVLPTNNGSLIFYHVLPAKNVVLQANDLNRYE